MNNTAQVLAADGVVDPADKVQEIKTRLADRAARIQAELSLWGADFTISNNGGNNYTTTGASVVLTGRAPVEVKTIQVTGAAVTESTTWPALTTWNTTLSLAVGPNTITVQGYDRHGNPLAGPDYTDSIVITRQ